MNSLGVFSWSPIWALSPPGWLTCSLPFPLNPDTLCNILHMKFLIVCRSPPATWTFPSTLYVPLTDLYIPLLRGAIACLSLVYRVHLRKPSLNIPATVSVLSSRSSHCQNWHLLTASCNHLSLIIATNCLKAEQSWTYLHILRKDSILYSLL